MQIASLVLIDSFLHKSKHSYADHIQPFLYTVLLTENGSISVNCAPLYSASKHFSSSASVLSYSSIPRSYYTLIR